MKKVLLVGFLFLVSICFAGYAYFTGPSILELPRKEIEFYSRGYETITLKFYKTNLSIFDIFSYSEKEKISLFNLLFGKAKHIRSVTLSVSDKGPQTYLVPFDQPGVYIAVLSGNQGSKTVINDVQFFVITQLGLISFVEKGSTTVAVVNTLTGKPVADATVYLFNDENLIDTVKTDEKGMVQISSVVDKIVAEFSGSYSYIYVYAPYSWQYPDEKMFVFTDRPIYRPGDTVHFRGQFFKCSNGNYTAVDSSQISVSIQDPRSNEVYKRILTTNSMGGFWDEFRLAETAELGYYEIIVQQNEREFQSYFMVEEYQKPEYKMTLSSDKEWYISGTTAHFNIKLEYFNGQPVVGADVAYYVKAREGWSESSTVYYGRGLTDEHGNLAVSVQIEEGFDGYYILEAIAADQSQRQIEESHSVRVHADNVLIKTDLYSYRTSPGETVKILIEITDLKGNPLDGTLTVETDKGVQKVEIHNGKYLLNFTPTQAKSYRMKLSFGKSSKTINIYSYGRVPLYLIGDFAVVPDKESYKPGEKMIVDIYSPDPEAGFLALVGEKLYSLTFCDLSEGYKRVTFEIPQNVVEKNLFLTYRGYSDGQRMTKTIKISLERKTNVFDMKISSDKDRYRPGETVKMRIEASDDYNICVSVVDEAIYAMVGYDPLNIEQWLYPENNYPNVIADFSESYTPYVWFSELPDESSNKLAFFAKEDHSFEDMKRSAVETKINVREYFPDTALWLADLETVDGSATIEFKVPDTITTWKVTSYGFSREQFSQGSSQITVTKDFYVRPHLPVFMRFGDEMSLSATVYNQTEEATVSRIWIEPPSSLNILTELSTTTTIPAQGSVTVTWKCVAQKISDPSTITIYAVAGLNDAVAMNVPVKPFSFEREYYVLEALDGEMNVDLPEGDYISASLRVMSNIVPVIEDSLKKLISYPYGCTEQTMSSFFPAVVASKAGIEIDNLQDVVMKGLYRLYKYQHYDGGWGWWRTDKSIPFMTAYVMEGLFHAIESGIFVADSVVKSGLDYLLSNPTAYGSYVLSLYGVEHEPFEPESVLDLVYLSLESKQMLEKAMEHVVEKSRIAYVDVSSKGYFITNVQATSILLRSLVKWNAYPEIQKKMINYLFSMKDGFFWYSTKDTSYAVLGLINSMQTFEEPDILVENDQRTIKMTGEGSISLMKGKLHLQGRGLVEVHVRYLEEPKEAVDEGLVVERIFYKKYEIPFRTEEEKTLVDAFIPLNSSLIPISAKVVQPKDTELYWKAWTDDVNVKYHGVELECSEDEVKIGRLKYNHCERLETLNGRILIISNDTAVIYYTDTHSAKFIYEIQDAALTQAGVAVLRGSKIYIDDVFLTEAPEGTERILATADSIFARTDTSLFLWKEGEFFEIPIFTERILSWDGTKMVTDVYTRFSGNSSMLSSKRCEILFIKGLVKANVGDILKTAISFKRGVGNYIVVEDFFPSCAQVIKNYVERSTSSYSKFDYMWFTPWDMWYSSREIHDDRVAFFVLMFEKGKMAYYWRATSEGTYKILPARAYSMYKKGIYGHSDPAELVIGAGNQEVRLSW